jgi:hypothetical protein
MAHEVVHLLLGTTSHTDFGLMKPIWNSEDLHFDSGGSLGLTPAGIAAIRNAAELRMAGADGEANRAELGLAAKPKVAGPRP